MPPKKAYISKKKLAQLEATQARLDAMARNERAVENRVVMLKAAPKVRVIKRKKAPTYLASSKRLPREEKIALKYGNLLNEKDMINVQLQLCKDKEREAKAEIRDCKKEQKQLMTVKKKLGRINIKRHPFLDY